MRGIMSIFEGMASILDIGATQSQIRSKRYLKHIRSLETGFKADKAALAEDATKIGQDFKSTGLHW